MRPSQCGEAIADILTRTVGRVFREEPITEAEWDTMTETQLEAALRKYAAAHGRCWKQDLRQSWMTGQYYLADDEGTLQRIRNNFGPSWLVRFSLSKGARLG